MLIKQPESVKQRLSLDDLNSPRSKLPFDPVLYPPPPQAPPPPPAKQGIMASLRIPNLGKQMLVVSLTVKTNKRIFMEKKALKG